MYAFDIFVNFIGQEATVAAVARYMREHGLTPDEVIAAYDTWLAHIMRRMRAVGEGGARSVESGVEQPATRNSLLHTPHPTLKRHKAGDAVILPSACPRCGGDVEMLQLCHISSPVWRTQLACMNDNCAWHGKSRLPIDALLAVGVKNIKHNVTEG